MFYLSLQVGQVGWGSERLIYYSKTTQILISWARFQLNSLPSNSALPILFVFYLQDLTCCMAFCWFTVSVFWIKFIFVSYEFTQSTLIQITNIHRVVWEEALEERYRWNEYIDGSLHKKTKIWIYLRKAKLHDNIFPLPLENRMLWLKCH